MSHNATKLKSWNTIRLLHKPKTSSPLMKPKVGPQLRDVMLQARAGWIILGAEIIVALIDYLLSYRAFTTLQRQDAHTIVLILWWPKIWIIACAMMQAYRPWPGLINFLLGPITLLSGIPTPVLTGTVCGFLGSGAYVLAAEHHGNDEAGIFRVLMACSTIFMAAMFFAVVLLEQYSDLVIKGVQPLLKPEAIISAIFLGPFASICVMRLRLLWAIELSECGEFDMWPGPPEKK